MSFIVLAVLVCLFVYLNHLDDQNPEKDPGYGTEHMGAYLILGLLGMAIAGVLIYILFTDLLGFLAAGGGVLIVFVCLFSPGFREVTAEVRDKVRLMRIFETRELRTARKQLKRILNEGRREGQSEEEYIESIAECFLIDSGGELLQYLPEDLKRDRYLAEVAAYHPIPACPRLHPLRHAAKELLSDRDFVLEEVCSYHPVVFPLIADELQNDPEIFIAALETAANNGINLKDPFNPVIPSGWGPGFAKSFYEDSERFLDFVSRFHDVVGSQESCPGQGMEFTSSHFGCWIHRLFEDWNVLRILFSNDFSGPVSWNEYWQHDWGEFLPESVAIYKDDGDDWDLYEITNKDFILFAIKEGSPEVLAHASDELKDDPEIKRLVHENTKGAESS